MNTWCALNVKARYEKEVAGTLRAKSLEAYVPLYSSLQKWSDRLKTIELPLFSGYVFCRFTYSDRIKIINTRGVLSIVSFSGRPGLIEEGEIETLRTLVQSGVPLHPWPILRIGDHVRVNRGPLSGVEGLLAREKNGYRVVVNVDLLQRAVAVEIDRDLIEQVGNNSSNCFAREKALLGYSSGVQKVTGHVC